MNGRARASTRETLTFACALEVLMPAPLALLTLLSTVQIARADIGGPNATMLPSATVNDGLALGVGAAAVGAQIDGHTLALAGPEAHMGVGLGGHFGVSLGAGQLMGDRGQGLTCVSTSARLALPQGERTMIAPWGALMACDQGNLGVAVPDVMSALGVAIQTGGDRVRLDLSVPVLSAIQYGDQRGFSALAPLFSEVGVSVALAEGQTLRVGTASLLPGLSYQGVFGNASVEIAAHGLAWDQRSAAFARASVAWSW